jgi:glycosyltransferase involved in cell wall biosynthesis
MKESISFVMITKNAQSTLSQTLEALKTWPHVVIYDNGSTDRTLDIIKNYPHVRCIQGEFEGFGPTRNKASNYANTPWVFHIDADEIPTSELLNTLETLSIDEKTCYCVMRDNYFFGKHMKGCSGWYPDRVVRLFHKNNTRYSSDLVHEKVLTEGFKIKELKGSLMHTPYQSFKQMIDKMNHYSDLFAKNSTKKINMLSPFTHSFFAFFKSYILKLGFKEGVRGYILSKYMADTAFYKYLKKLEKDKAF